MSRYVDSIPTPEKVQPMRVMVLSPSRNGTMGLWKALKILGYKSYHNLEGSWHGVRDYSMLGEALRSRHDKSLKPYDRADFDKLFQDYDAILEVSGYLAPEIIKAYLPDPNVKFILLEREPEAFVRSFQSTIGEFSLATLSFPLNIYRYFDAFNSTFFNYVQECYAAVAGGRRSPQQPGAAEAVRTTYIEHNVMVKRSVPASRLKVIKLEEGLGWEQVCEYLGHEIPDAEYPSHNVPNEVMAILMECMRPGLQKAKIVLTAGAMAALATGAWFMAPTSHDP